MKCLRTAATASITRRRRRVRWIRGPSRRGLQVDVHQGGCVAWSNLHFLEKTKSLYSKVPRARPSSKKRLIRVDSVKLWTELVSNPGPCWKRVRKSIKSPLFTDGFWLIDFLCISQSYPTFVVVVSSSPHAQRKEINFGLIFSEKNWKKFEVWAHSPPQNVHDVRGKWGCRKKMNFNFFWGKKMNFEWFVTRIVSSIGSLFIVKVNDCRFRFLLSLWST